MDKTGGEGVKIYLKYEPENLKIEITYLLYPGLPLVRKKMEFENIGKEELKIESLDIERLRFARTGSGTNCWVMKIQFEYSVFY